MEPEGSAGAEPQGLVAALGSLDFKFDGKPVWGFQQGSNIILRFEKTRWMDKEWPGEG